MAGLPVTGADDLNYAAVMGTVNVRDLLVEQASWLLLNLPASVISDSTLALRITGLIVAILGGWAMTRPVMGRHGLLLYAISILPLYLVLYFAQIRLLLSFIIFVAIFAYPRIRPLAGPASLLGHLTGLLLAFPPILILVAPLMELASYLDPTNVVALKISAYLGAEYFARPWYFGWELAVLATLYLVYRRPIGAALIVTTLVGIYLTSDVLGVIVSRRLIELSLLAYSPLVLYLRERRLPDWGFMAFYVALGVLQTGATLAAGVVQIG